MTKATTDFDFSKVYQEGHIDHIIFMTKNYLDRCIQEEINFKDEKVKEKLQSLGWVSPEDAMSLSQKCINHEKEIERLKSYVFYLLNIITTSLGVKV